MTAVPPEQPPPYTRAAAGLHLAVRLTPRAARNGVDGVVTDPGGRPALQLRIVAPPVDGAANAALIAYVAASMQLRKSDVTILAGAKARFKRLELRGDPVSLLRSLTIWLSRDGGAGP